MIGGGAAGMMAAAAASDGENRVVLYEKNEKLGKKIYITGKGRCNVTNACDAEEFYKNIVSNPKFMYGSFERFNNMDMMRLLETNGCPLKTERGERVFPVSDHASDVTACLERMLKKAGVRICLQTAVKEIVRDNDTVTGVILPDGRFESFDAVILAAGGKSYPTTGSSGDGYLFAQKLGHTVCETRPALVPFVTQEAWCGDLQGLALKNIKAELLYKNKKLYVGFGEMLFTHFGISGPLVLSASSFYSKKCRGESAKWAIDLKPALTQEQLDKRLLREFDQNRNKQFKNAAACLFPARLLPVMLGLSGIDPDKKVNEITKQERLQFVKQIKNVQLNITGTRGFQEAVITQGGVAVREVNPATMESKIVKGLYFAGEVLDLDALTGGFNLQIAWSTGFAAGKNAGAGTDC